MKRRISVTGMAKKNPPDEGVAGNAELLREKRELHKTTWVSAGGYL
jgi:hypothetical protein